MRALAMAFLLLATGCTALVQPAEDRVRCVVGDVDPCPDGERCFQGFCTPVPDAGTCLENEIGCNGIDDDCDGIVDEGSDFDGDGFTWCDEDPALRDCRDDDPTIYPGAPEDPPCDGADNDCSGTAAECPTGQLCHPDGGCAPPDCSFVSGICTSSQRCNLDADPPRCEELTSDNCTNDADCAALVGTICDPVTRTCIEPHPLGESCAEDAQCAGADAGVRCFEAAALGLTVSPTAKVCSCACCSNADCPVGSVCWASGTGARGCLPRAMVGDLPHEPCGRDRDCSHQCRLEETRVQGQSRYALACGSGLTWNGLGASCGEWYDLFGCASGICLDGKCSAACGNDADCGFGGTCGYVQIDGRETVQACVFGSSGSGSLGASCREPSDCSGWTCLEDARGSYCAEACCTDADCGSGYVCRPASFGTYWGMLCQQPDSST